MKKILIGTPIHECKDYCLEQWLASVSHLNHPFDLLLVDNSPHPDYVNRVHRYCRKNSITNYKLVHIDLGRDSILDQRLAQSREIIRQEVLLKGYHAWCSLECDIIAPPDALSQLVDLIEDYWLITHTYPSRLDPHQLNQQLGLALVTRLALEKYSPLNAYGYVNPQRPDCWYGNDVWFIRQIDTSDQGKHINVGGIIKPIYHLSH